MATEEDKAYQIDYWASLFKATTWEEIQMLTEKSTCFEEASKTLYELMQDENIRLQYQAREDYERMERHFENIAKKYERAEREKAELENENAKLNSANQELASSNEELKSSLLEKDNTIEQLKAQIEQLKTKQGK